MSISLFFFFNAPPTTDIYTLSLHDALPILLRLTARLALAWSGAFGRLATDLSLELDKVGEHVGLAAQIVGDHRDRKSTRLNSSHPSISYAVFCLKKKNTKYKHRHIYCILHN